MGRQEEGAWAGGELKVGCTIHWNRKQSLIVCPLKCTTMQLQFSYTSQADTVADNSLTPSVLGLISVLQWYRTLHSELSRIYRITKMMPVKAHLYSSLVRLDGARVWLISVLVRLFWVFTNPVTN